MPRPFRFGLHFWELPLGDWSGRVRRYEGLGFAHLSLTDHVVVPQWDPFVGLSAMAAVTERIRLGTLVLDMALRNPVLVAKAAATLDRLSGGRLDLGLGAGYVTANATAAGEAFAPAGERIARLEEALVLMGRLWREPQTTFEGRFFRLVDSPMVAPEPVSPRILIGGGGPSVMGLGGRRADVVSMIPRQSSGDWSVSDSVPDSTLARMAEKAAWVARGAEAAGRDPESVELNTMVATTVVGDRPQDEIRATARDLGLDVGQLGDSSLFLCGTADEVTERLLRWREVSGLSSYSLFDLDEETIDWFAERVLQPLEGA